MEFKKVIALCKRSNALYLIENGGVQWLSDGYGMYPLFDLPRFDEDPPASICLDDEVEDEVACDFDEELFGAIIPVQTSQGVMFIRRDHLSPFNDTAQDTLRLFERHSPSGATYFAVKIGFMLVGVVLPYDCINDRFVEKLKRISEQCEVALFNKRGEGK